MCYENELQYQQPRSSTSQVISQSAHSLVGHQQHHQQQQQHQQQGGYQSNIEQALINAKNPLDINTTEQISAGPYRGLYLNKQEVDQWRGPVSIDQYRLCDDPNPEVIKKRLDKVRYTQELGVKYLNPPPAQKPGDLIIREKHTPLPPAPPLILRQEGERSSSPPPQVYREAPPPPPPRVPEQVIEVESQGQAPGRRVIVERLSNLPPRPANVIVEKWLPYRPQKRRVVFQRANPQQQHNCRNLIIEWEAPEVEVVQQCKDLGVVDADPEDYVRRYGSSLLQSHQLPSCEGNTQQRVSTPPTPIPVQQMVPVVQSSSFCCRRSSRPPSPRQQQPVAIAVQQQTVVSTSTTNVARCPIHYGAGPQGVTRSRQGSGNGFDFPELEGEIDALRLVDLNKHGLQAYSSVVNNSGGNRSTQRF